MLLRSRSNGTGTPERPRSSSTTSEPRGNSSFRFRRRVPATPSGIRLGMRREQEPVSERFRAQLFGGTRGRAAAGAVVAACVPMRHESAALRACTSHAGVGRVGRCAVAPTGCHSTLRNARQTVGSVRRVELRRLRSGLDELGPGAGKRTGELVARPNSELAETLRRCHSTVRGLRKAARRSPGLAAHRGLTRRSAPPER